MDDFCPFQVISVTTVGFFFSLTEDYPQVCPRLYVYVRRYMNHQNHKQLMAIFCPTWKDNSQRNGEKCMILKVQYVKVGLV